jgi:hypothetical protein
VKKKRKKGRAIKNQTKRKKGNKNETQKSGKG